MNPSAELQELIEQAREHVRYLRELGVAYVGEEAQTTPPLELSIARPVATPAPPVVTPFALPPVAATPAPSSTVAVAKVVAPPATIAPDIEERLKTPAPSIDSLPALSPPVAASIPKPSTVPLPKADMAKPKKASLFDKPALFEADSAPADPTPNPGETLEAIRAEMGDCKRCKLWTTRTKLVFGEGSGQAELIFVGEAPGADEDATGRPFIGRAGQLLTKMIEAIGLKREDVYIANVIKSRPPGNRNPEADEVKACSPFLIRQIASIKPRLIVTLGNPATQALLETKTGITKLRGEFQDYPRIPTIKVIPTFHPAYLLRSPDKKREAWEDLKKVRAFLRGES